MAFRLSRCTLMKVMMLWYEVAPASTAHARAALMMASILLAAGVFTGIMQGSGMLKAMAQTAVGYVPPGMAQHIPFALGLISMPLSLLFDPDSFYFGILPVVAEVGQNLGVPPLQVGQA